MGRRWREQVPRVRPVERLAADLRRLRDQRRDQTRSRTQREGARLAYEDVLREVCVALGIMHYLDGLRGVDRQLEILRLEEALVRAGLVLSR